MSIERARRLITQKENVRLEFKEAANALPANLFETICAMLNREGGDIILGVDNSNVLRGVNPDAAQTIISNVVNLSNNPQKLDPPFILFPQAHTIDGKIIIHIQVPSSSQLHKTSNIVFDRSNDGDFKITQAHQIAQLYNIKRIFYTENTIYPYLKFEHFKADLFTKVKNLICSHNHNHPWRKLSNKQLLKMAGLWRQDNQANQEGYTLAAALLFGKDQVIQSILPHYKIDALLRVHDVYRYDDREYIQTNLVDAYDQLMAFIAKHLPDRFYMINDQRVSLRSKIFREIVGNLIVHREYMNAYPCTLVIHKDRIETTNGNNPHGDGPIDPKNFAPFPKNPVIAKFFAQIGRADELGSGVLNVNKFIKEYSGKNTPLFIEGPVFRMRVPLPELMLRVESGGLNEGLNEGLKSVYRIIQQMPGIQANKISELLNDRPIKTVESQLKRLAERELIERQGSKKTGGYFIKTVVNIEGLVEPLGYENGGLNGGLNEGLKSVYMAVQQAPGSHANTISELLNNRPIRTIERQLKALVDKGLLERRGSKKAGGYFVKNSLPNVTESGASPGFIPQTNIR